MLTSNKRREITGKLLSSVHEIFPKSYCCFVFTTMAFIKNFEKNESIHVREVPLFSLKNEKKGLSKKLLIFLQLLCFQNFQDLKNIFL